MTGINHLNKIDSNGYSWANSLLFYSFMDLIQNEQDIISNFCTFCSGVFLVFWVFLENVKDFSPFTLKASWQGGKMLLM